MLRCMSYYEVCEGSPHRLSAHFLCSASKGDHIGDLRGTIIGIIKGDTRSLDYSSYTPQMHAPLDGLPNKVLEFPI